MTFKGTVRLTPLFNPIKGQPRPITYVNTEEEFYKAIKDIDYACEVINGGKVKVYLDIDYKVPLKDCDSWIGNDELEHYREKNNDHNAFKSFINTIENIPLFSNQPFVKMTRKERRVDDKVKFSYRFVFKKLIVESADFIKTYLESLGFVKDKPFDLSVYNVEGQGRIMNAVYCRKPENDCLELRPIQQNANDKLEDYLITCVDDSLPVIQPNDWIKPKEEQPKEDKPKIEKPKEEQPKEDMGTLMNKVEALLKCLNPDCPYPEWFEILTAVKSVLGDTDDAYNIADTWSAEADNYSSRVFAKTWTSINDLTKITIGTLIHKAKTQNPDKFQEYYKDVFYPTYNFDSLIKLTDYPKMKTIFETRVCKVVDSIRFVYKEDDTQTIRIMSRKQLKETYEHLKCMIVVDGKERIKSFIDTWVNDPTILTYDKALNIPPPLVCPKNILNLWTPYKWASIEKLEEGEFKTIEDHLLLLCGNDKACADHTIKTLAYKLQFPAYKTKIMLIFVSEEGTGKNLFYDVLIRIFGEDKCFSTPNVGRKIFGDFANVWANKQIVLLNDFNPAEVKKENSERLKDYITETNIVLEKKGIDEYEGKQFTQFIAFSQSYTPIANNSGSRRFFQMECSREKIGNETYFKTIVDWTNKDENIYAWYKHLIEMDLTDFNPTKFPITDVSLMAKKANASPVEAFIEEEKKDIIKKKDIINCVMQYKKIKTINEKSYTIDTIENDPEAFMALNHRFLFTKFRTWACGNLPEYQSFTQRKFQIELYRLRQRLGLEYVGNNKHPERTYWKVKHKEKWIIEDDEEETEC